jgi:hypothetical protein
MNLIGEHMTTNYVEQIKQRANAIITQPESNRNILNIPPSNMKFKYPTVKADMTTVQLCRVMDKISIISTHEMLHLLSRCMVRP